MSDAMQLEADLTEVVEGLRQELPPVLGSGVEPGFSLVLVRPAHGERLILMVLEKAPFQAGRRSRQRFGPRSVVMRPPF